MKTLLLVANLVCISAFLETAIPLKVVAVSPSNVGLGAEPFTLNGKQAITVTFSRPVIAIGSDWGNLKLDDSKIPFALLRSDDSSDILKDTRLQGRWRWVTTFVARFDMDNDWPTDLKLTLQMNKRLTTFDKIVLTLGPEYDQMAYTTPALSMISTNVYSALASEATGNRWNEQTDGVYELPPDAEIVVKFNYAVDATFIANSVKLASTSKGQADATVKVSACPSTSTPSIVAYGASPALADPRGDTYTQCVRLVPSGVKAGQGYLLKFPVGMRYNNRGSGLLSTEISVPCSGLKPFVFTFFTYNKFSSPRLDIYSNHGFSNSTTETDLLGAFTIRDASNGNVPFTVQKTKAYVRLLGVFSQSKTYTLVFNSNNNVRDYFEQKLQPMKPENLQFSTVKDWALLGPSTQLAVFESSQYSAYQIVKKAATAPGADVYMTTCPSSSYTNCLFRYQGAYTGIGYNASSVSAAPFSKIPDNNARSTSPYAVSLSALPLMFLAYPNSNTKDTFSQSLLVSTTDLFLNVLAVPSAAVGLSNDVKENFIQVWVTRYSNGSAVENADIDFNWLTSVYSASGVNLAKIKQSKTKTNKDGVATLKFSEPEYISEAWLSVSLGKEQAVTKIGYFSQYYPVTRADSAGTPTFVLDRSQYKEGDDINAKVYLPKELIARTENITVTSTQEVTDCSWALQYGRTYNYGTDQTGSTPVRLKLDMGTLFYTFTARKSAKNVDVLYVCTDYETSLGSTFLQVEDPRVPTSSLSLDTTALYYRVTSDKQGIPLVLTTLTNTGAPIAGAEIKIHWVASIQNLEGELFVTTDLSGKGKTSLVIDELLTLALAREQLAAMSVYVLDITATYQGATGETLVKTVNMPISKTDFTLSLSNQQYSPLPNTPLMFSVNALYIQPPADGRVELVDVALTLVDNVTDAVVNKCQIKVTVDGMAVSQNASTCSDFSVPKMGVYQLMATSTDKFGTSVKQMYTVDARKPDMQYFQQSHFDVYPSVLKKGEKAVLRFYNLYPNSKLMLSWSTNLAVYTITAIETGFVALSLDVPKDCHSSSCSLLVAHQAPRQAKSFAPYPADYVLSVLEDYRKPFSTNMKIDITIASDVEKVTDSLKVQITAPKETTPGAVSTIRIKTTYNSTGAVVKRKNFCVFGVDKSYFEVYPHAITTALAETYQYSNNNYWYPVYVSSANSLISKAGYDATVAAIVRRGKNDSWYQPSAYEWAVTSNSYSTADVDKTDTAFFATRGSSNTDIFRDESPRVIDYSDPYVYSNNNNFFGSAYYETPMAMASPMIAFAPSSASMAKVTAADTAPQSFNVQQQMAGSVGGAVSSSPGVRADMVVVPLSVGSLNSDTEYTDIPFTAPDNIGTFSIFVYAFDGEVFGSSEVQIVSQKKLNLNAMLPRLSRVGDQFDAGVTVAVTDPAFKGDVVVTASVVSGGFDLVGAKSQTVKVVGTTPVQVYYQFNTTAIGAENKIRFAASALGGDALESAFPVYGLQDEVFVATSMAITADAAGTSDGAWQEQFQLPAHVPGSGRLEAAAGVGRYPAVLNLATRCLVTDDIGDLVFNTKVQTLNSPFAFPGAILPESISMHFTSTYLAQSLVDASLHRYERDATTSDAAAAIKTAADTALAALASRTHSTVGLLSYFDPASPPLTYYTDISTNLDGLYMKFRRLLHRPDTDLEVPELTFDNGNNFGSFPDPSSTMGNIPTFDISPMIMSSPGPIAVSPPSATYINPTISKPSPSLPLLGRRLFRATAPGASNMVPPPRSFADSVGNQQDYNPSDVSIPTSDEPIVLPIGPINLNTLSAVWFNAINDIPIYLFNQSNWNDDELAYLVLSSSPFVRLKTDYAKSPNTKCQESPNCWSTLTDCSEPSVSASCKSMCGVCTDSQPLGYYPAPELLARRSQLSLSARLSLSLAFLLRPGLPILLNTNTLPAEQKNYLNKISTQLFADGLKNVQETVQLVLNNLRVQGRTAYITATVGGRSAAAMQMQARALEVLSLHAVSRATSNLLIEKLANYLSSDAASGGALYYWSSSWSFAQVATALGVYDGVRSSLSPNLNLTIYSGSTVLLQGSFTAPTSPVVTNSVDTIPSEKINFKAVGTGEVSVAIGATFVPAGVSQTPIYRGMYLEKTIKRCHFSNRSEYGETLATVERGALLSVTIQITSPDDLTSVTLTDLLPGGLEIELPQGSPPIDAPVYRPYKSHRPCWWGYCPTFDAGSFYSDRAVFTASFLPAGSTTVTYYVIANTPGRWNLPPAKAAVDAQPELMGLSGGGLFLVSKEVVPPKLIQQFLKANKMPTKKAFLPMDCAEKCGATEMCDIGSGSCIPAAYF